MDSSRDYNQNEPHFFYTFRIKVSIQMIDLISFHEIPVSCSFQNRASKLDDILIDNFDNKHPFVTTYA